MTKIHVLTQPYMSYQLTLGYAQICDESLKDMD